MQTATKPRRLRLLRPEPLCDSKERDSSPQTKATFVLPDMRAPYFMRSVVGHGS